MKFSWRRENTLDEMQEYRLLHIEKNGFWFLYWALIVAILVQLLLGTDIRDVAAELICFLAASVFLVVQCIGNGIWDRHLKPDRKTNLVSSILAGVIVAFLQVISYWLDPQKWQSVKSLAGAMGFSGILTFVITFFLLSVTAMATKRRRSTLEREGEESDD